MKPPLDGSSVFEHTVQLNMLFIRYTCMLSAMKNHYLIDNVKARMQIDAEKE